MGDQFADLTAKLIVRRGIGKTMKPKIDAELFRRPFFLREKAHRTFIVAHKDRAEKIFWRGTGLQPVHDIARDRFSIDDLHFFMVPPFVGFVL